MQQKTIARVTLLVGILLIFTGLVLFRPITLRPNWSIDIKDTLHWAGIASMIIVALASIITLKNIRKKAKTTWLNTHCTATAASTLLALIHSRTRAGIILPIHYHSYITLTLMILLTISGIIIRTYPKSESVKKNLIPYHMPLTTAFFLTLTYHILAKIGAI